MPAHCRCRGNSPYLGFFIPPFPHSLQKQFVSAHEKAFTKSFWICRRVGSRGSAKSQPVGRGRSAKRSALYDAMKQYRGHFQPLLEAELKAEQDAILQQRDSDMNGSCTGNGYIRGKLIASKQKRLFSLILYSLRPKSGTLKGGFKFSKGDLVNIMPEGQLEDDAAVEGTVLAQNDSHLFVTVPVGSDGARNMDTFVEEGQILMAECGTNSLAFERASFALQAITAEGPNTSDMSRLLVMSFADIEQKNVVFHESDSSENNSFYDYEMPQDFLYKAHSKNGDPKKEKWDNFAKETVSRITSSDLSAVVNQLSRCLNVSQILAIKEALQRRATLIQGPPGTGKTITTAYLIMCVIKLGLGPVLACAASNVAADNLLRKIVATLPGTSRVVRIGKVPAINEDLWEMTLESLLEKHPPLKKARSSCARGDLRFSELIDVERKVTNAILSQADVVVATCAGSGRRELQEQKFPFVVVDEATQATEPDVLIPLSVAIRNGMKNQLVLVGDHHQLPPTTLSRKQNASVGLGLETSLFLRLWQNGIQCRMLNVQYRMHPDIAKFPAYHFYFKRLHNGVSANGIPLPGGSSVYVAEQMLRSRVVFFNVAYGHEESDRNSIDSAPGVRSFFNKAESDVVTGLLDSFVRRQGLPPSIIGVISPYAGQVKLLNESLQTSGNLRGVDISTVDGFQGREKDVIILSAVRSNARQEVGFLRDWRRLNVAITRARTLLIVVGNEKTLASDYNWRSWLKWVKHNGMKVYPSPDIEKRAFKTS